MDNKHQEIVELKSKLARFESMDKYQDDEIDLRELFQVIWAGKIKIFLITTIFAVLSVVYALSLPDIYKSEALLVANSQESTGLEFGAVGGQLGGIASLAGINLNANGSNKVTLAIEVLKSRQFIYEFVNNNNLKKLLLGVEGWDKANNKLIYNSNVYDSQNEAWLFKNSESESHEPSDFEIYKHFLKENLTISKDSETQMLRIGLNHYSPLVAKDLLEKLISTINYTIKEQDLIEAKKSILYLKDELERTEFTGMQAMFYKLIEQQQQKLMLTNIRPDYVFKVIDRPIVTEEKSKPNRSLICIIGIFFGGSIGVFFTLFRYFTLSSKY